MYEEKFCKTKFVYLIVEIGNVIIVFSSILIVLLATIWRIHSDFRPGTQHVIRVHHIVRVSHDGIARRNGVRIHRIERRSVLGNAATSSSAIIFDKEITTTSAGSTCKGLVATSFRVRCRFPVNVAAVAFAFRARRAAACPVAVGIRLKPLAMITRALYFEIYP
jgi:hypothetical protein